MNIIAYMALISAAYLAVIGFAISKSKTIEVVVPNLTLASAVFLVAVISMHLLLVETAVLTSIFSLITIR